MKPMNTFWGWNFDLLSIILFSKHCYHLNPNGSWRNSLSRVRDGKFSQSTETKCFGRSLFVLRIINMYVGKETKYFNNCRQKSREVWCQLETSARFISTKRGRVWRERKHFPSHPKLLYKLGCRCRNNNDEWNRSAGRSSYDSRLFGGFVEADQYFAMSDLLFGVLLRVKSIIFCR